MNDVLLIIFVWTAVEYESNQIEFESGLLNYFNNFILPSIFLDSINFYLIKKSGTL